MFAFYHDYSHEQSLTRTDGLRTPSSRVISMHLFHSMSYVSSPSILTSFPFLSPPEIGYKITAFLRPAPISIPEKCPQNSNCKLSFSKMALTSPSKIL